MMIGISKEDGDKILEEFLIEVSKINGSKRCAEESFKIMDNFSDSQLIISILMINAMRQQGNIPAHITDFERQIISALTTMFSCADKEDIPIQLQGIFDGTDDEILKKVVKSNKLNYAVQQFVSAYYFFDLFESKYPEISKML
jgi:hypothetical protein